MAYGTVDRNNGNTFREQDVDQFMDNDDYLRNEADYKCIASVVEADLSSTPFEVNIDGGSTIHSGTGAQSTANVSLSAYADGLHFLDFGTADRRIYFVKTPDTNYLSLWSNASGLNLGYLTVIAHRDTETW